MTLRQRIGTAVNAVLRHARVELRAIHADDIESPIRQAIPEADEETVKLLVSAAPLTLTPPERQWALVQSLRNLHARGITGDVVECGVWRGGNLLIALAIGEQLARPRRVWGFDTFEGMTAPGEHDVTTAGEVASERFARLQRDDHNEWCYASLADVSAAVAPYARRTDVRLVKGRCEETLRGTDLPETIALLRLDTDWYESTRVELEVLYPRLLPGGVLIVDDYGHWQGARRAVDEYFREQATLFWHRVDYTCRLLVKP